MDKHYVLVKYRSNWADEVDVEGFYVMPTTDWAAFEKACGSYKDAFEIYVGTNESIEYEDGEAFLEDFDATPITMAQKEALQALFGTYAYGHFPNLPE